MRCAEPLPSSSLRRPIVPCPPWPAALTLPRTAKTGKLPDEDAHLPSMSHWSPEPESSMARPEQLPLPQGPPTAFTIVATGTAISNTSSCPDDGDTITAAASTLIRSPPALSAPAPLPPAPAPAPAKAPATESLPPPPPPPPTARASKKPRQPRQPRAPKAPKAPPPKPPPKEPKEPKGPRGGVKRRRKEPPPPPASLPPSSLVETRPEPAPEPQPQAPSPVQVEPQPQPRLQLELSDLARKNELARKIANDLQFIEAVTRHELTARIRVLEARQAVLNLAARAPPASWMAAAGPRYVAQVLDSCERNPGLAISAERYEEIIHAGGPGFVEGHFAICHPHEVRHLLSAYGSPKIPLLVPAEWNHDFQQGQEIQKLFQMLSFFGQKIEVQYSYRPLHCSPNELTRKLDPAEVERCFKAEDQKLGPINLLDLDTNDDNPVPPCVAGLTDLALYAELARKGHFSGGGGMGRLNREHILRIPTGFKICGQAGVFSEAHTDHLGKTTTVLNQEGLKLWPVFSSMAEQAPLKWFQQTPDTKPDGLGIWIPIFLEPGSLLIQPPGTLHAPYSITDVFCTGTMHIDTRGLLVSINQAIVELDHPEVTNDDHETCYLPCMFHAAKLWKARMAPYSWGSEEDRLLFLKSLRVYIDQAGKGTCCNGKKAPKPETKSEGGSKKAAPAPGPPQRGIAGKDWFHTQNCALNKMLVTEGL